MLGSSKSAVEGGGLVPPVVGGVREAKKNKKKEGKREKKEKKEMETALEKRKRELERERKVLEKREKELEKKKKHSSATAKRRKEDHEETEHVASARSATASSSSSSPPPAPYLQGERRRSGSWIRPRSLMLMKRVGRKGDSSEVSPLPSANGEMEGFSQSHLGTGGRSVAKTPLSDLEGRASGHVQEAAAKSAPGYSQPQKESDSPRDTLLGQLKLLKANDRELIEFKTPPTIMQELQASTIELVKIISDCLVFNTHLKVCASVPFRLRFVWCTHNKACLAGTET